MFATINECTVCGKRHDSVQLHAVVKPNSNFTHWYTCPETGEPEFVRLEQFEGKQSEIDRKLVEQLATATQSGEWLVCVFRREGKKLSLYRQNQNFPLQGKAAQDVVSLLQKDLSKEGAPPEAGELKEVDPPKAPVSLFGPKTS